jgi:hypothetical protein
MLEFLRDKELIKENPYITAKIKKLHFIPSFGMTETDYGGRVRYIAELKDKDLLLIIGHDLTTIDVARLIPEEVVPEEVVPEEVVLKKFTCKKCNEGFDNQGAFLTHTRKCKID